MGEEEDRDKIGNVDDQFYDVDKFKEVVNAQQSTPKPSGARLVLVHLKKSVDSMLGLLSTFAFMMIVFIAPVVIIVGILYGLVGFLVSFGGIIGGLSFYANRRLGKSARFGEGSLGIQLLAQLVGCSMIVVIAYLFFFVILKR